MQNLDQVAAPGKAIARMGEGIAQAGNDIGKIGGQVAEGVKAQAAATFTNNYTIAKNAFDESLKGVDPNSYAQKQIQFNQSYNQTILGGISEWGQRLIAPDVERRKAMDLAAIGIKAHVQQNETNMYDRFTAIQNLVNAGNFDGARKVNDDAKVQGFFDPKAYTGQREYIEGSRQKGIITDWTNGNPHDAQEKIQWAIDNNKQLPGLEKISVDELKAFKNTSIQVGDKQDGDSYKALFAVVEDPKTRPQTIAQLESDRRFDWLSDDKKQAVRDQFLEKAKITDPSVVQAAMDAKQAIHDFNPTNDARPYQSEQQLYQMLAGVPKAQRAQLGEMIEDKMKAWLGGGGVLPAEKLVNGQIKSEIITMGKAGLLGGDSTDPVSIDRRTHDIETAFNAAWADPKQRGNGSLKDARQIIDTLTQKNQWGAGASEGLNNKPSGFQKVKAWFGVSNDTMDFIKQQEGFTRAAYTDSDKDTGSIGYGTHSKPGEKTITEQEATSRLAQELSTHEQNVTKAASTVGLNLTPSQKTALVSFDFNTGAGAKVIQETGGDMKSLVSKIAEYKYATVKGEKKALLVNRRNAEISLLNS